MALAGKIILEGSPHIYIKPDSPLPEFFTKTVRAGITQHWAIKETREAARLKTDVAVFHFNLATYYDVFRFIVLPEFKSLENVFAECLKEYRKAIELDPANFEYASTYARTLTYSPKIWRIKDSYPASEKIKAWEYCLPLAPDRLQKEFMEREIKKLK